MAPREINRDKDTKKERDTYSESCGAFSRDDNRAIRLGAHFYVLGPGFVRGI